MTLSERVHPEAEAEFLATIQYYEAKVSGLGDEFDIQVTRAVDDIRWSPEAWPRFPGWNRLPVVRTRRVGVFPYRIVYFIRDDEIVIVALAATARRPGYWKHRIDA